MKAMQVQVMVIFILVAILSEVARAQSDMGGKQVKVQKGQKSSIIHRLTPINQKGMNQFIQSQNSKKNNPLKGSFYQRRATRQKKSQYYDSTPMDNKNLNNNTNIKYDEGNAKSKSKSQSNDESVSYSYKRGMEIIHEKCIIAVRYREKTEIKSSLINGGELTIGSIITMENIEIGYLFALESQIILVEWTPSDSKNIHILKIDSASCIIDENTKITYTKKCYFSQAKVVGNQFIGICNYPYNPSYYQITEESFQTVKNVSGIIQLSYPNFNHQIIINDSYSYSMDSQTPYYEIWKIQFIQTQLKSLSISLFVRGGYFSSKIHETGRVYIINTYTIDMSLYDTNDRIFLFGIELVSQTEATFIESNFILETYSHNGILIFLKDELVLTRSTRFFIESQESGGTYIQQFDILRFSLPRLEFIGRFIFGRGYYIQTLAYCENFYFFNLHGKNQVYNIKEKQYYSLLQSITPTNVYKIYNNTFLFRILPLSKTFQFYKVVNRIFVLLSEHTISIGGYLENYLPIFINPEMNSIAFYFQNMNNTYQNIKTPSIVNSGFYYLYISQNVCLTRVPTSRCSFNSTIPSFGSVYKHWNSDQGNFWTAPSQTVFLIRQLKINDNIFLCSISENQVQVRNLALYPEERVLKNPSERKLTLKI